MKIQVKTILKSSRLLLLVLILSVLNLNALGSIPAGSTPTKQVSIEKAETSLQASNLFLLNEALFELEETEEEEENCEHQVSDGRFERYKKNNAYFIPIKTHLRKDFMGSASIKHPAYILHCSLKIPFA